MPEFSGPAPFEDTKATWLHERGNRPAAPARPMSALARRYLALALGLLFALGLEALAFETRATFDGQRDWVVPVTTPFFAIGGVALAVLLVRKQLIPAAPGIAFLCIAIALTIANVWRGQVDDGQDYARDILSILTAVALAASLISLVAAIVWSELRNPTRAPLPEV